MRTQSLKTIINKVIKGIGICCGTGSILLVGKGLGNGSVRNMQACAGVQEYGRVVEIQGQYKLHSHTPRVATVVRYSKPT